MSEATHNPVPEWIWLDRGVAMKTNLTWVLRIGAFVMALFALIAAISTSEVLWSVRWPIWLSAALVAFFAERMIEPAL